LQFPPPPPINHSLKLTKPLIFLFTLCVFLFSFVSCPTPPEEEEPEEEGGPDGFIGLTIDREFTGVTNASNTTFTHVVEPPSLFSPLNDFFTTTPEVKLTTDGKFTLKLGEVKQSKLIDYPWPSSVKVTPGLQIFSCGVFFDGTNLTYTKQITWRKDDYGSVTLFYANKDGTINGTETRDGMTMTYNVSLKQGWNTVIATVSGSNVTGTSGHPDASYKWVVINNP
jgi:hypothetical protein